MERFWTKVDKTPGFGPRGDCWLWTAGVGSTGYGQFGLGGRMVKSHRVAYELEVGPIPTGMYVLHSCDEKRCVNPAHLRIGTQQENIHDMDSRGRRPRPTKFLGVHKHNRGWRAYLKVRGGKELMRCFQSFNAALTQRREWEAQFLSAAHTNNGGNET